MDFNKLTANEKLGALGAAAVVVGGIAGYSYSLTILGVILALGLLVVVFLPLLSPTTTLPGSKGSLMLITGGAAGAVMILSFLAALGVVFIAFGIRDVFFLVAVAGGVIAAWAGWQEFQSEGGKLQLGAATPSTGAAPPGSSAAAAPPPAAAAPSEPPSAAVPPAAPPPAAPPAPAEPETDSGRDETPGG